MQIKWKIFDRGTVAENIAEGRAFATQLPVEWRMWEMLDLFPKMGNLGKGAMVVIWYE